MAKNLNEIGASNLRMLEFAATKLGDLCEDLIFVGGCTTALLINDKASPDVRFTMDVDCIIDVISAGAYYKFEKKLRAKGFEQSLNEGVICRWVLDELLLDVMPTDEKILGFSNCWYKSAIEHPFSYRFATGIEIKVVSAPYFLATKIEAFKARGASDYLASHDFEDIIAVLNGRIDIVSEVKNSSSELRKYLADEIRVFNQSRAFHDALPGHLSQYGLLAEERARWLLDIILKMTYT